MRFDITLPDLVPSCCDDLVYAILFDKNQNALKDNGFGILTLQPYVEANHADYAIVLAEHAERDRYYFADLADADFVLADNAKGECYQVEYWRRPVAGTYARSEDELRETRRVVVNGKKLVDAVLSAEGVSENAVIQSRISATYDSENQVLRFMAHLESNGALVANPQSVVINIIDGAGTTIFSVNSNLYVPNVPGVFYIETPNADLQNDAIFVVSAVITDVAGVTHTTVSYLNTWD